MAKSTVAVRFTGDIAALKQATRDATQTLGDFGSKAAGVLKTGLAAAGAVGAAALTKGFTDALNQEKAADKVAASFGLSPEVQERLGSVAGKLYADAYGESFAQVMDATANVQRSLGELTDTEVEGLTANALDFAAVFDADVNEAISSASLLLKNGLVGSGEEAFDLLTVAMQRTAPAVRDEIFAATTEYSTFFADLGIKGTEAFALITRAAEKGGQFGVDKVGDALKELGIRGTDMSEASQAAFEAAGLDARKMSWRFLQGGDTARGALDDLVEGLQNMDGDLARSEAAIALFGTPLEDLSVSEIPDFLAQLSNMEGGLGDTEGAADEMGDTLNDNLSTKIEAFKRKGLQRLADFMSDVVIPAFERMAPVVSSAVDAVSEAIEPIADTVEYLVGIFKNAFQAGDSFGLTGDDGLEGKVAVAGEAVRKFVDAVGPFIEDVKDAFGDFVAQFSDDESKIGKILKQLQDTFSAWVDAWVAMIQTAVKIAKDLWERFGSDLVTFIRETFDNILDLISGVLEAIQGVYEVFAGIFTGDWERVWEGIKNILSGVWDSMRAIIEQALNLIDTAIQVALGVISAAWSLAWNALKTFVSDIWSNIVSIVSDGVEDVIGFVGGIHGRIKSVAESAFDALLDAFKGVVRGIAQAWNSLSLSIKIPDIPGVPKRGESFDLLPDVPVPFTPTPTNPKGPNVLGAIPEFDMGGIIPGPRGSKQLVFAHGGETVLPTHKPGASGIGANVTINMNGGDHDPQSIARTIAWVLAG